MTVKYSICICNYNMADTIERSLTTILEQVDERFEVLIVDDGSSDNSVEIVKSLQKSFASLHLIQLERDSKRKLGYTRNIAIQKAKGEFVLLHLDCDDIFDPYLKDFVEVFHRLEECIGYQILLSGQHINMANREFLLAYGPYRNLYRGEDRDLWSRLAKINAYIPFDHVDFVTRLPKTYKRRFFKNIKDTFDHMCNDFRAGITLRKYIYYEYLKRKSFSFKLMIFRYLMLMPAYLVSLFQDKLSQEGNMQSPEAFAAYREKMRGNYYEIMVRNGGDPDLSFLSLDAQKIFK